MEHPDLDAARIARAVEIANLPDAAIPAETWTAAELREQFEVLGFAAPFVVARRISDGTLGSLEFRHFPRVYFNWVRD